MKPRACPSVSRLQELKLWVGGMRVELEDVIHLCSWAPALSLPQGFLPVISSQILWFLFLTFPFYLLPSSHRYEAGPKVFDMCHCDYF